MSKIISIIFIILRLALGGMMIYGGIQKFKNLDPSPIEVVEKAQKFQEPGQRNTLQKILYINGMKQTGYFWQVLGICEIIFGILLIMQGTGFIGAIFLLPITLHIFLFHLFLESDEVGELFLTGGYFLVNTLLIVKEYERWKKLVWIKIY
ncbi:DoxX family membrane protein [Aquimarina sp. AU474]|uniref:DoxX family membrane protein n=1 Tax=Aquimarina sp. AU474 TaxID=2108529 RepID=UPI000D689427|nr:DoxX family membrane protein [Aquimarina sp. AU474]